MVVKVSEEKGQEFDYDRYCIESEDSKKPLKVGVFNYRTRYGSDVENFHETLLKQIESEKDDIIIAPEFSYSFPDRVMSEKEKKSYVEEIKEATKGKDVLVLPGTFLWYDKEESIHDTAPIISEGEQIKEYHKFTNGNMFYFLPEKCEFIYDCPKDKPWNISKKWMNSEQGGIFKWNGNKVGVEICSDHYSGMLREAEVEKDDFDLQVVISCGIMLCPESVAVKKGGYAVYCDGDHKPSTQIIKKKGDFECVGIHPELIESDYYSALGGNYRDELEKKEASKYLDIQPIKGEKGEIALIEAYKQSDSF